MLDWLDTRASRMKGPQKPQGLLRATTSISALGRHTSFSLLLYDAILERVALRSSYLF